MEKEDYWDDWLNWNSAPECPECKAKMFPDMHGGMVSTNEDGPEYVEVEILACSECDHTEPMRY